VLSLFNLPAQVPMNTTPTTKEPDMIESTYTVRPPSHIECEHAVCGDCGYAITRVRGCIAWNSTNPLSFNHSHAPEVTVAPGLCA
jgi:hypothetical protein